MIITNAPGGAGGDAITKVTATWPSGSTCTATLGSTVLQGGTTGSGTFELKKEGTWTIACTDGTQSASSSVAVAQQTATVALSYGPSSLDSYTWAQLKNISDSGDPGSYGIKVGDYKTITLNGTISDRTFTNQTAVAKVIGINHNSSIEGSGITFQLYSIGSQENVAIVDSKYPNNVSTTGYLSMNSSNTNVGGWNSSQMRSNIMSQFKALLSSDLQAVIKSTTKYSDNTGGGSDTASYVTATTEECFLLSEYEVQGARTYANSAEQNYQAQYAFYANGGSKIKYGDPSSTKSGSAVYWWLRSVYSSTAYYFCLVSTAGYASNVNADDSRALAPAFRV